MFLLLPFLLPVGLFLPGFFIGRFLERRLWWASAFVISLLILFHSVFWLGISGVPITLRSVLPCLLLAAGTAGWLTRRSEPPAKVSGWLPSTTLDRILVLSTAIVGVTLLARSAISPLVGFDTVFRWDFLAQKLLALGRFDFYPPLTPSDFRQYFLVDGIPPLVSFTHWWLYASAGKPVPWVISLFVIAQFVCTLAFTFGAASSIFSRRAGFLAAAILAASPLYFRAIVLGQETGLTALSIAAMIYFMSTAEKTNDVRAMILAGMAAGLCALSREYGWIAVVAGEIVLVWKRQELRRILVFVAVAMAVAFPWYARNWILTGNPFYTLKLGTFAVNPIYSGILQHYHTILNVQTWGTNEWTSILSLLLLWAPIQMLAGIGGSFRKFRQHGYLIVNALLLAAVWVQSAAYTSGGIASSARVLSPAVVILSILGAGALEPLMRTASLRMAVMFTILVCQLWTAAHGVFFPNDPLAMPLHQWRQNAFQKVPRPIEFQICDELVRRLPPGSRILSDNAYLHVAMSERGIDVVPVWSPEVRFLFSAGAEEAEHRLQTLGITSVAYYPQSLNTGWLASASPFYASLPQRWGLLAEAPGFFNLFVPITSEVYRNRL
jgi:Dolichyl-phosphate-mannose-protein mannosyltransferase